MGQAKSNYDLLIGKLDTFIRKYYINQLIKGALLSLGLILILFLAFNLLEHFYYFDKGTRKLLFFSFIGVSAIALLFWVLLPAMHFFKLGKTINHTQAASIIGDHFTDVKDKLLNILQLKEQARTIGQKELIEASINQKSSAISPVPFKTAIDLRKNKQYLKYALPPFLLLLLILFGAPSMITDSTHRIINNDRDFEKAAPFHFNIQQEDLSVLQFEDFRLDVEVDGEVLPNEVFIDIDNYQYRLQKDSNNKFSYVFKNVQKSQEFTLFSGDVGSGENTLEVLPKPGLVDFSLSLDYPSYTQRKDEMVQNIGDLVIPAGTNIRWSFNTKNTEDVFLKFGSKESKSATQKGENKYNYRKSIYSDQLYTVYVKNQHVAKGDSIMYNLNVIPDQHPSINVQVFQDSIEKTVVYFAGNASDDYGLNSLSFNYQVINESGVANPLVSKKLTQPKEKEIQYDHLFDINELELQPGQKVNYYFEVFDNDAVNGSKSAKTNVMSFDKPSIEEFEEMEDENEEKIKDNLEDAIEEAKKIQEDLKKLKDELLQKKELDWQDKKELEKLMERHEELQKMMDDAKQKMDENMKNQQEFSEQDEEIEKKQEKIQEMMEEVMDEETKDLMEKIQELMDELDKEQSMEMMEEFEMDEKSTEDQMERLLELYKQLEVEKEAKEIIEELEKLAEEEEKLSEETAKDEKSKEELKKKQEEIEEKFEELKEKMEELEEKNEELEFPKDLGDKEEKEEDMEEISEDMEDSQEQMDQGKKKEASKKQKSAAEKMKNMAGKLKEQMEAGEQEQQEEDLKALRQLLENIVTLSFDQEELTNSFSKTNINTPRYVSLLQNQFKIKDDFQLVEDSLKALSRRVTQIETFVTEKVDEVNYNIKESVDLLEQRQKPTASQNQRFTMKNLNDLALMLTEAMQQMQEQMAMSMPGSQMCNKPGGSGKGKKKGKGNAGSVPMDKISKGQEGMSKELQEMIDKMKQGEGKGKGGSGGMAKEFAEAAAKQAALRKALEEIQNERQGEGKGMSQELQEIIDQMDKNEIDLVNKKLDTETYKRHQDIMSKLLEAEKADRQREYDNKRKGETGEDKERKLPPSIEEYLKKREAEVEMYKTISPSLKPYYKNLVEKYYNALKGSGN